MISSEKNFYEFFEKSVDIFEIGYIIILKVKESQSQTATEYGFRQNTEANMANISDIIENFILSNIGDDSIIQLSRNELAGQFNCVPSQINYVLSTRFTPERGYVIESRRGGGGYITVIKIKSGNQYEEISKLIGKSISDRESEHILIRLIDAGYLSRREAKLIYSCINDKALASASDPKAQRAEILKNLLPEILK